jgi:flagellar hook-associated protein 1 FlgK
MLNTLNVAQSGLNASQTQVENVMNNIANENTVGYKKRVVDVKEAEHTDSRLTGRGSYVNGVDRVTNAYVYERLIEEESKNSQHDELSNMLADIESIFYETNDSGFSNDLDKYFQAIEDLRANPFNEIYRSNLNNQGTRLVDDLKTIYSSLESTESIGKKSLGDSVVEINSLLKDIGTVNKQIIDSVIVPNALYDERDLLENKLAKLIPIDVETQDGYVLSIAGLTAVRYDSNIHNVTVKNNEIAQKDVYADLNLNSTVINAATWDNVGVNDSVTYYFNKETSVTVSYGDAFTDAGGVARTVDTTNVVQALVSKINSNPEMAKHITAYNGQYSINENGIKQNFTPETTDHYLMVESRTKGFAGKFDGKIVINDDNVQDTNSRQISNVSTKNTTNSVAANSEIYLEIFESELKISSGKVKSTLDNLNTLSSENKYTNYKKMLDEFAKALSDYTEAYIDKGDNKYIYGEANSLVDYEKANIQRIGLFEGTSVNNLTFNSSKIASLSQNNLDYLSTMQFNTDIQISSTENTTTSLTKFYERIRVTVSQDKENVDYIKETQNAVTKSLQLNYDKLTKVNKDEELINLVKFQSAYEANAKLITIVDEMLATILGMKR